eukprot:scpid65059/ scgid4861/ 
MATAIHQVGSSVSDVSDAATVCHQSWRTQWHWCAFTLCQGRSRHHDAFLAVPHETRTPWSAAVNAPVAQQMKAEEGDPLQRCLFYTQSGTLIFTCVHVERNTNVQTGRQYTCADWQTIHMCRLADNTHVQTGRQYTCADWQTIHMCRLADVHTHTPTGT